MADTLKIKKKDHLWLTFRHEGGGGHGSRVENQKKTTSGLCLDAREVVVVADMSKVEKKTTSGLRLHAREVVVVLALKVEKKPPPARVCMRGRWWWWQSCRNRRKDHLQLAFGCKGGGGGGTVGIPGVSGG